MINLHPHPIKIRVVDVNSFGAPPKTPSEGEPKPAPTGTLSEREIALCKARGLDPARYTAMRDAIRARSGTAPTDSKRGSTPHGR